MKKIKITTVRECLADLLELPGDLAYHGCIITLIGEREILLENYRSILEYRSDHLLVLTANGRIRIQGVSLSVLYYTALEMKVTGQITSVLAAWERSTICPSRSVIQAASVVASNNSAYPVLDCIIRQ